MIRFNILNSLQLKILTRLNGKSCATRVTELGIMSRRTKLEFKRLSNLLGKPSLLCQLLIIIRDVNCVGTGKSRINTIDLGKVLTTRLRQGDGCHGSNIGGCVRALHTILHIICNVSALRNPEGSVVTSHRLERRQDHRGLAMNRNGLSANFDVRLVHNGLNWKLKLHSIVVKSSKVFSLEELFKTGEERLDRLH